MTSEQWANATDPQPMLTWLREQGKLSDRKARLFAVAVCRRIWPLLVHEDSFRSIETAEEFADGRRTIEELRAAEELGVWAGDDLSWHSMKKATAAWAAAAPAEDDGASAAGCAVFEIARVYAEDEERRQEELAVQSDLLRDIVGDPFRTAPFDPAWRTPQVVSLACQVYDSRDFSILAVLSDALEEAGCSDAELLGHLRGAGPHAGRGCWALDEVLGRG